MGLRQLLLLQQSAPSGFQLPDVNAGKKRRAKGKGQRAKGKGLSAECRVLRLITIFFAKWVPVCGCQCRKGRDDGTRGRKNEGMKKRRGEKEKRGRRDR